MNDIATFYIRLLRYAEACEFVKYANKGLPPEDWIAALIQGGIQVCTTPKRMDELIVFIVNKGWTYEVCKQSPDQVRKQILKGLRDAGRIQTG